MQFAGRAIVVDIEGTTSSIAFVHQVMFPFVRRELDAYLRSHWTDADVEQACNQVAKDAGHANFAAWLMLAGIAENDSAAAQELVKKEVHRLMDGDVKATGLKALQGLIWEAGFASGELVADVFADVPPALDAWNAAGKDVRVYSSGSIKAQLLFFGHTQFGNLLSKFRGHFDTTIGNKREAASYGRIADAMGMPANEILFVSDLVAELDAAQKAGMQTALTMRPGNPPLSAATTHPLIHSLAEIELA
ncbi:MAG: acireductone synthase [Pirellulales bacterium]